MGATALLHLSHWEHPNGRCHAGCYGNIFPILLQYDRCSVLKFCTKVNDGEIVNHQ
jgi:hypothetical protein